MGGVGAEGSQSVELFFAWPPSISPAWLQENFQLVVITHDEMVGLHVYTQAAAGEALLTATHAVGKCHPPRAWLARSV